MSKKSIGCAVLGVLLWWSAVLGHDDANTPFAGPASTSAYVAYNGTLICFRCAVSLSPENRARCEQEGHLSFAAAGRWILAFVRREHELTQRPTRV